MENIKTREEIIAGLALANDLMRKIVNLQNQINVVYAKNPDEPLKSYGKPFNKKTCIILCVLASLFLVWPVLATTQLGDGAAAVLTIPIGVGLFFLSKTLKQKYLVQHNNKINEKNKLISASNNEKNERIKQELSPVTNELFAYQKQYSQQVAPWYPADYCTFEAVEFFYNAVKNFRANTIGEAVNLYENYLHQQRIEQNQQAILDSQQQLEKQQKLNNILQVGQIAMQAATVGAINANTNATYSAGNRISGAIFNNTNALNGVSSKLSSGNRTLGKINGKLGAINAKL